MKKCYGLAETVQMAELDCIWYGSFANTPGRLVLVRDPASTKVYDLALFTTDTLAPATVVVERYATRWSIEVDHPWCTRSRRGFSRLASVGWGVLVGRCGPALAGVVAAWPGMQLA